MDSDHELVRVGTYKVGDGWHVAVFCSCNWTETSGPGVDELEMHRGGLTMHHNHVREMAP